MENPPAQTDLMIEQARMLVQRLERVSADSIWARRASGLRGALLRRIEEYDYSQTQGQPAATASPADLALLQTMIDNGFWMLERAAAERLR